MATKIRAATSKDVQAVINWLHNEWMANGVCMFYDNRKQFRNPHGKRVVLEKDGIIIGYMDHSVDTIHFFVIHWRYRGMGYGKRLFSYKSKIARKSKSPLMLAVEPHPKTSIPFWQALGFVYDEMTNGAYKYYGGWDD